MRGLGDQREVGGGGGEEGEGGRGPGGSVCKGPRGAASPLLNPLCSYLPSLAPSLLRLLCVFSERLYISEYPLWLSPNGRRFQPLPPFLRFKLSSKKDVIYSCIGLCSLFF